MVQAFFIEPGTYNAFENEAEQIQKCKEWGLLSEKASKGKTFFYKGNGLNQVCSIIGYADKITAVIELENKQKHCIHPSYLKEMQAANYGQRLIAAAEEPSEAETAANEPQQSTSALAEVQNGSLPDEVMAGNAETKEAIAEDSPKGKSKKEKAPKLQLPEEKVKMKATVKEFTTVPNHFSDTDDEVIVYDEVFITESETGIGSAWSSHSATLKKMELQVGDTITFEGKIVAKKLTKHPVPYKINNPAKIQKEQA